MQNVLFVVFFAFGIYFANGADVRVVHASPDAPAVDVLVNGTIVRGLTNIAFGEITRYVFFYPGTWNFKVVPAGASSPVVIDQDVDVSLLNPYTIAAANQLSLIEPVVFNDDLRAPDPGNAAIRFVHLSPDAPAVDIAVRAGPTLFTGVSFKSATKYLQLISNFYSLQVKVSGTDNVVLEAIASLDEGRIYSIYVEGFASSLDAIISIDL